MSNVHPWRENLRIGVIGYGSIGRRHARNLRTLGCCNLQIFDPVSNAASDDGAQRFESLESLLASKPDIVLITSPSVLHEEQLFNVLAAGIRNVFVEKPFVCSLARSDDLLQAAAPATVMIGCNFRFHPGIRTLKNLLDQSTLGTPIFARIEAGQYLPSWQPNSDYRLRYSAKIALGGGALLDYIHEVDYANWLFGSPQSVFANVGASGSLEIETDDFADLSVTYSAGLSATIHVDYLQPRYARSCKIVGDMGSAEWDIHAGNVVVYLHGRSDPIVYPAPPGYELGQMYLDEMEYFLSCLERSEKPFSDPLEGLLAVKVVEAAKESSKSERKVSLSGGDKP